MSEFLIAGGNTSAQAKEWAAQQGLVVRVPEKDQLFVDIDDERGWETYLQNYDIVDRVFGIRSVESTPSRNKPQGKHVVVRLFTKINSTERCLLQAILGSDPRREGHSLSRIQDGDAEPTLFFEKPEEPCTQIDLTSQTQSPQI